MVNFGFFSAWKLFLNVETRRKECEHDVVLANGFHCAGSVRDFLV
jgi:sRNA-binding regulator protein Hfq